MCDLELNTPECGYDNNGCVWYNENILDKNLICNAVEQTAEWWKIFAIKELNDGECKNDDAFNTPGCLFDGGDCEQFNLDYPDCGEGYPTTELGNGKCKNDPITNSESCGFDGGDCIAFNSNTSYAGCMFRDTYLLGNGQCDGPLSSDDPTQANHENCAFDGGDCLIANVYPSCDVASSYFRYIGGE